jgi:hypothetical protein
MFKNYKFLIYRDNCTSLCSCLLIPAMCDKNEKCVVQAHFNCLTVLLHKKFAEALPCFSQSVLG